jgi:hypothetical protein
VQGLDLSGPGGSGDGQLEDIFPNSLVSLTQRFSKVPGTEVLIFCAERDGGALCSWVQGRHEFWLRDPSSGAQDSGVKWATDENHGEHLRQGVQFEVLNPQGPEIVKVRHLNRDGQLLFQIGLDGHRVGPTQLGDLSSHAGPVIDLPRDADGHTPNVGGHQVTFVGGIDNAAKDALNDGPRAALGFGGDFSLAQESKSRREYSTPNAGGIHLNADVTHPGLGGDRGRPEQSVE